MGTPLVRHARLLAVSQRANAISYGMVRDVYLAP